MDKVRAELGRDALVIEKRELKPTRSLFKLGGEELVEIIAASPEEYARTKQAQLAQGAQNAPRRGTLLEKTYGMGGARALEQPRTLQASTPLQGQPQQAELPQALVRSLVAPGEFESSYTPATRNAGAAQTGSNTTAGMAGMEAATGAGMDFGALVREQMLRIVSLQARGGFPAVGENLLDAYQSLIENDVNPDIARTLVESLQREMGQATLERQAVTEGLARAMEGMIRTGGAVCAERRGDRPSVVALVGPSGGGKTTTIVKIAFDAAYNQKKKVGIINEDFSRPGAMAQLQGLIQILELPLVTAESPQCMADRIRSMGGLDLVLIDTAGRSPRDAAGIAELEGMLAAARPDEVHLAVPGCSTERMALSLTGAFRGCGFQKLILSKLDEAPNYGLALNLAAAVAEPFSYLTVGQKWSSGLCPAQGGMLARLVLGLEQLPTA